MRLSSQVHQPTSPPPGRLPVYISQPPSSQAPPHRTRSPSLLPPSPPSSSCCNCKLFKLRTYQVTTPHTHTVIQPDRARTAASRPVHVISGSRSELRVISRGIKNPMDMAHERDASSEEEVMAGELRRGPWTVEEDLLLVNYVAAHGEGRWNSLARSAGLKRTGKSCRLRWLNYLRPDLRRGNITPQEQLLILELHSRWGNRWSKIAQHLPGRTDNEIKNYWRTRVQKHAKQLKCDVNSQQFKDVMRYLWMPRLVERIQAAAAGGAGAGQHQQHGGAADTPLSSSWQHGADDGLYASPEVPTDASSWPAEYYTAAGDHQQLLNNPAAPELSSTTAGSSSPSSDSGAGTQPWLAPVGGAEWFTTVCDASSAAAAMHDDTVLGPAGQQQQHQQQPCLLGGETWTSSSELPELGVADFEIGSFDVESIWSMDDNLWFTQTTQGV